MILFKKVAGFGTNKFLVQDRSTENRSMYLDRVRPHQVIYPLSVYTYLDTLYPTNYKMNAGLDFVSQILPLHLDTGPGPNIVKSSITDA